MTLALFGATGKTGSRVLEQALAEGHKVNVLVRSPGKLGRSSDTLTVIEGDMMNGDDVRKTVEGTDAVIMAAGPVKSSPKNMLEVSAGNIVSAMKQFGVTRIVWLTGAGVTDERDGKSVSRVIIRALMKVVAGSVLSASERAYDIVKDSGLDYTVVRPPMLADEPGGIGFSAGYKPPKPIPVGRGDLAAFLLSVAVNDEFVGESPLVSYEGRGK